MIKVNAPTLRADFLFFPLVVWTIQALNDLVRSKVGLSNDQPFEMSILKDDKSGYVSLDDGELQPLSSRIHHPS